MLVKWRIRVGRNPLPHGRGSDSGAETVGDVGKAGRGVFADSPAPASADEKLLAGILQHYRGRSKPLARVAIERMTGWTERRVKQVVEALRMNHHLPIGSTRSEPHGYFWIVTAEDHDAAWAPYRAQVLKMWRLLAVQCRRGWLVELHGQLRLPEGGSR